MPPRSTSEGRRSSLQLTDAMDQILLDALLHQTRKGNRVNDTFTTIGMNEEVEEVRTKTQMTTIDKEKVRNRMKTLKKCFGEAYDAFKGLSGFGWNPITKLFEADDDVWKDLIKANPNALQWKTRPISQYDKLHELWGKDRATGEFAQTAKERVEQRSTTKVNTDDDITIDHIDNMVEENVANIDMYESSQSASMNQGDRPKAQVRKRRKGDLASEVGSLRSVMEGLQQTLADGNAIMQRSRYNIYQDDEVFAELDRLGVHNDVKMDAFEFLTAESRRARNFFGMPQDLRKDWLYKKMYE